MRRRNLKWIGLFMLAAAPAAAQDTDRAVRAERITGATPVIDGRLDEAAWSGAEAASDFTQRGPQPGAPATQRTEARVLYDDDAIYVGFTLWDEAPDSIAAQLGRRDAADIFTDWVEVIIDSYHDRRTGYRFAVNPRGVQKDVYHYADTNEDSGWDAVWESAAAITAEGWSAELRIPLSQLRFARTSEEQTWGVHFVRFNARRDELAFWSPILPTEPGMMSRAGRLTGLRDLGAPDRLEVMPYTVSQVKRSPRPETATPNPFFETNDVSVSAGADLKYGLTSNLTLNATINPDFGQVEADPSVVNLSAFETFFAERRPFFVEGAQILDFNIGTDDGSGESLFYTRRIGRTPQRNSFDDADHRDLPERVTILGAAKLTGRTASGWSIGVLDAVTQAEEARIAFDGTFRDEVAEPLTNYFAARAARDLRGGLSSFGFMGTVTHRDLGSDPALAFLRDEAYSGGVDARHRFGNGNYQVSAFLAASRIGGDTLALQRAQLSSARYFARPDAQHLEYDPQLTSMNGWVADFGLSKMGGAHWRGGIGAHARSPGFEVNDIGFQTYADQKMIYGNMTYNQFEPQGIFRSWYAGINPSAGWDFGNTRLWSQINFFSGGQFRNLWGFNIFMNERPDAWTTNGLRGGPAIRRPGFNNFNFNFYTDRRKPIIVNAGVGGNREKETNGASTNVFGNVRMRPSTQLEISLGPSMNFFDTPWQYVASPEAETSGDVQYVFASLEQRTFSLTTRVSYTMSPTLSFQLYAQPFISAGSYSDYKRVVAPRARSFDARFQPFTAVTPFGEDDELRGTFGSDAVVFDRRDFNVRELTTNAVLRWEYRPGSALFVVWSQAREGSDSHGRFNFGDDLSGIREAPGTNVLLVKASYWMNF